VIRPATPQDAEAIAALYGHYVDNTVVTFEEEPVTGAEIARRIEHVTRTHPWFAYEKQGALVGYAYAAPWHLRCAYRLSVETTIYLDVNHLGQGIGSQLYGGLIAELKQRKFHCAIGGIALPNDASVALHEKLGFRKAGEFKEVGYKLGRWIDVGYWELFL
jgi:phosphinothricin acetyltransferase